MTILLLACRQSVEFSSWPALAPGEISFIVVLQGDTVMVTRGPHSTGLFHAGSVGIIMSGWLGAANYGVIVSNEVDRLLRGGH